MFEINERPGYADDYNARTLIESGDYGNDYRWVSGSTEAGQLVRAIIGDTPEAYKQHLDAPNPAHIKTYGQKRLGRRKQSKVEKQDRRRHQITEVTFDDPHIRPRYMKTKDFINLYSGIEYANTHPRGGYLFNVMLTISWGLLGFDAGLDDAPPLHEQFIDHYTEWCRYNKIECIWIYSNEFSGGLGLHSHFMTAIKDHDLPKFLAYIDRRMLELALDKGFPKEAYKISDLKRQSVATQWMKFQYLCKGVDPHATLRHSGGKRVLVADLVQYAHESPGNFTRWKRCGISRNIGSQARKEAGFISTLEKGIMNIDLLYGADKRLIPEQPSEEDVIRMLQVLNI